jgi:primosomal protein N'
MKKVLTTVAGLLTFALVGTACGPAVDTQETTSTTPIAASQRMEDIRKEVQEFKASRSAVRPTATPTVSTHENHVNNAKTVAAAKAAKAKAARAKAERIAKAKAEKLAKYKALKKKKAEQAKKAVKKTKKTVHKVVHKTKKVGLAGIAACIAKYESGGNPRAQNPHSSASGLFQFIDGTWNHFGGYARAMYAPVSVQLQKFYIVWDGGRGAGNWVVRHKCGY